PVVFKESKQWMVLDIGPMVGYQMSSLTTNVMQDDYDHLEGDFDKSGRLFGGLHLNFTFPRLNERLSLVTGLIYLDDHFHSHVERERVQAEERNDVTIRLQQLALPIGLRYTFPERQITPYINIGGSYQHHLKSSSSWVKEIERLEVIETFEAEAFEGRT